MRWTALVVAVLACGCGDGGGGDAAQADTAPACDIPPMVCEDGSAAVPATHQPEKYESSLCWGEDGDPVQSWAFSRDGGPATHHIADTTTTTCWSPTSTVARLQDYTGAGSITCWAQDGEPADCADIEAELFEITK